MYHIDTFIFRFSYLAICAWNIRARERISTLNLFVVVVVLVGSFAVIIRTRNHNSRSIIRYSFSVVHCSLCAHLREPSEPAKLPGIEVARKSIITENFDVCRLHRVDLIRRDGHVVPVWMITITHWWSMQCWLEAESTILFDHQWVLNSRRDNRVS